MALTNTGPASISSMQRGDLVLVVVHTLEPKPERGGVGRVERGVEVGHAQHHGHRTEDLLLRDGHVRGDAREHGRARTTSRRRRAPPRRRAPWRPGATASSTWPTSSSRWASVTIGPTSVAGSKGSPTTSASIAAVKRSRNSSCTSSTTMNRLAAMHDCPLFCTRAVTAVRTHASRSAEGKHDEGVRAAELEHALLQRVPGGRGHRHAGALAPRQRDRGHPRVGDDLRHVLGLDEEVGEHPVGQPGPAEQVLDGQRRLRHVGARA